VESFWQAVLLFLYDEEPLQQHLSLDSSRENEKLLLASENSLLSVTFFLDPLSSLQGNGLFYCIIR
jgi:hypothetical protein